MDQEVIAGTPAQTAQCLAADSRTQGAMAKRIGLRQD
jgi:hypothetical protein